MKTTYYKSQSNCFYQSISKTNNITVDLYDFNTAINISKLNSANSLPYVDLIQCTKLEFDKAYNLALALISNKSLNK